jgi:hypothetical protein
MLDINIVLNLTEGKGKERGVCLKAQVVSYEYSDACTLQSS